MYPIGVKALADRPRRLEKISYRRIGDDDMRGRKGFLLVETPNMQLMNSKDAGDLKTVYQVVSRVAYIYGRSENSPAFSRSCCTSARLTPEGTLSSRMCPEFRTTRGESDTSYYWY